jgi:type VI secretion system secreted protein VgrG
MFSLGDVFADRVASFSLVRELGRPPVLEIDVRYAADVGSINSVGNVGLLSFGRGDDPPHEFAGLVEEVEVVGSSLVGSLAGEGGRGGAAQVVRLRVVSRMALLDGIVGSRIYQDKDVQEIVTAELESAGIPSTQQRWQLAGTYAKRPYCVRYQESSLAFVSRLMEEEGIYFTTTVADGDEVIVFGDDSPSSDPIDGDATLHYRGDLGVESPSDGVIAVKESARIRSGKFVLTDYDFERPKLDLTATAAAQTGTDLERFDYPGLYNDPNRGKHLARVRLEAEQVLHETVDLVADSARLAAGRIFTLDETPLDDMGGDLCVTRVAFSYGRGALLAVRRAGFETRRSDRAHRGGAEDEASGAEDQFVAVVTAIPKDVKFRTEQTTPRPVIRGPQLARVVGPEGADVETIHTDKYGRIKVKFPWDMTPVQDDKATFWMRVTQLQTSGSMVLPRLDWEVVVEFLEGNPDRPIVTGKLYNGLHMPPYALPEGKTRTGLKTASSPGGGGTNEIRMEDRAGGEEIAIHAQYDQTIATANDKSKVVGNNASRDVKVDETIDVSGNQTIKITIGSDLAVGGNQSISVGGNRNHEVNAVTGVTTSGDETISVGGNHFEMDGNPLQALLQIAAEKAIEVAQAAASAALDRVNAAVQSRVDQVMAPINDLTSQVSAIGEGMQAVADGDLGAIAGIAADAAGLPMPPGFGGDSGGETAERAGGGGEGGEGGGEGGEGGGEGGEAGPSYTEALGIDSAVNSAIATGIQGGANALGAALGFDSAGGGGASAANVDGPVGDVAGFTGEDRTKGPGHSLHKVDASYSESVGTLRVQAAITGLNTEVGGNLTETIGAAKINAAWGDIAATVGGNKSVKTLGQLVFAKGDEEEASEAAMTTMVGGLVYEKVGGGVSIEASAPATFIGAFHKIDAATAITLTCGASTVVIDGSGVAITSPLVAVLASKISLTKAVSEV